MYYIENFYYFDKLHFAIDKYTEFYNTRRLQATLKGLTPIEYRNQTLVS
ncbi:IS3 family transposase [Clostridium sp. KNHs214]